MINNIRHHFIQCHDLYRPLEFFQLHECIFYHLQIQSSVSSKQINPYSIGSTFETSFNTPHVLGTVSMAIMPIWWRWMTSEGKDALKSFQL